MLQKIDTHIEIGEKGSEKLMEEISGKDIFFDPTHVPGVAGNLSEAKLKLLSARGVYLAQNGAQVIVTSPEAHNIAKEIRTQIQSLHINGFGDFEITLAESRKVSKLQVEPYGYFGSYYENGELIEENQMRIFWSEFFNNKARFFDWMKQEGFSDIIPETHIFQTAESLTQFLSQNPSNGSWVKAGIGASGAGSWKIGAKGPHSFSKEKLEAFDTTNQERKYFDENGRIISTITDNGVQEISKKMPYILQASALGGRECSISYFIADDTIDLITETINIADGASHEGNHSISLPKNVKDKFKPLVYKVWEAGYRGPIGFDFFHDTSNETINIIEANPRHTGATTPATFCQRIAQETGEVLSWSSGIPTLSFSNPLYDFHHHKLVLYNGG